MKHAGKAALTALAPLLRDLRGVPGLIERATGTFYWKSRAYLHFHEDPTGLFADAKFDRVAFERLPVTTKAQQARLLERVIANLAAQ